LAFSTRILPIAISPLPYNNDGLTECRIAQDIAISGNLEYVEGSYYADTHSIITPAYDVLLAFTSLVIGTETYDIAQLSVGIFSMVTIICIYLLTLELTGSRKSALISALFLGLFGTFVYLTGSTWKESLGVALLTLFYYSYVKRADKRMLILGILVLGILPFVHHLVTIMAYLSFAFFTLWSLFFAWRNNIVRTRHWVDLAVLMAISAIALGYYKLKSHDRIVYFSDPIGLTTLLISFAVLFALACIILSQKRHARMTFAPIPAIAVFALFVVDYVHPIFPYTSGSPVYTLLLAGAMSIMISVAWFGFENIIESKSRYRAIPLGLLLPTMTFLLFAVLKGFNTTSHWMLYRSFDFADIGLAVGIGLALMHFAPRPRVQVLLTVIVLVLLVITFPFGYFTSELVGIRHDTQQYETDAFDWIAANTDGLYSVQTDERLSYVAMAWSNFEKIPYLPSRISGDGLLGKGAYYVLETEWTTIGVNDYPRGHPVLDPVEVKMILESSQVCYLGGPFDNQLAFFYTSTDGQDAIFGYH